ncbi:hypothetical protein CPC08DRAFT_319325 [Agrocybe pediades]|nr:hypothetical protein CPC08DRAFT_319325 [Agrocybe pediades]
MTCATAHPHPTFASCWLTATHASVPPDQVRSGLVKVKLAYVVAVSWQAECHSRPAANGVYSCLSMPRRACQTCQLLLIPCIAHVRGSILGSGAFGPFPLVWEIELLDVNAKVCVYRHLLVDFQSNVKVSQILRGSADSFRR